MQRGSLLFGGTSGESQWVFPGLLMILNASLEGSQKTLREKNQDGS
jgi:hypothetical protein